MKNITGSNYPNERNLEKDRETFLDAITNFNVQEIPTLFNEKNATEFELSLKHNGIFILGEMHGVSENPNVIYTLFKKFGFRQVALEWEPNLKSIIEKYIETGKLDFEAIKESPDGRITAGHFAVLRKLKQEGLLDGVMCFDTEFKGLPISWNKRDKEMAKNILSHLNNLITLVIAGNYHTRTSAFTFDGERKVSHPMGENLKRVIPDLMSGRIEYLSGQWHNYGQHTFITENDDFDVSGSAKFYQNDDGLYVFELPVAHSAVVPNPTFKEDR